MPPIVKRGETGKYEVTTAGGEQIRAFLPAPLPPVPSLVLDGALQPMLEKAVLALGRLDGVSTLLPDKSLFLYTYVRKEAVLSSQIEGTQSSLSDLLLYENAETPGVPLDDVQEVSNYVAALNHAKRACLWSRPAPNPSGRPCGPGSLPAFWVFRRS